MDCVHILACIFIYPGINHISSDYNLYSQDINGLTLLTSLSAIYVAFLKLSWLHDDVVGGSQLNGGPETGGAPGPWPSAGSSSLLEVGSTCHPC